MNFTGKILLVDDEVHIRKYVGLILKQVGQPTILEAANGEEAVALYSREKPDLVLLDVNMPKMDGIETLKKIQEIDPNSVVIMLTSLANRQTVEEAMELGAANYIRKDTPKDDIAKALTETIDACFKADNT
jgi:two-component system chemotaxis response regulator CheY